MSDKPWILGISASPHNGAVCLLKGDEIVVAIQEERLTRKKREGIYASQPCLSIDYCLDYAGIRPQDLSMVTYCVTGRAQSSLQDISLNPILQTRRHHIPTSRIPHHLGHAIGAFATSGFRESSILVIDGAGSPVEDLMDDERAACRWPVEDGFETISLYAAHDTQVKALEKQLVSRAAWVTVENTGMPTFGSLGGMYSAVAKQIFGDLHDAGKVMGLAPYGEPEIPAQAFFDIIDGQLIFNDDVPEIFTHNGRWPTHEVEYKNLAASTQAALEMAVLYLVERLHRLHGSDNLCYAGGVALNSVANERIIRESPFRNVSIMAAAEDSGPAIGAAYYGLWQLSQRNTCCVLSRDAVGREYPQDEVVEAINRTPGIKAVESADVLGDVADLLRDGNIVGWFEGRSELGPRALGQRSILCDPRRADGKEVLNSRVKFREAFRPFAPVVLLEEAANWFDIEGHDAASPFMLRVCEIKPEKRELIPAVVHVDGTGRFQTVTPEANPTLHALISKFHERTGVPIILNTSFNVMGEPIVETPADALATFLATGIDYLFLQGHLIAKSRKYLFEYEDLSWYERVRQEIATAQQLLSAQGAQAMHDGAPGPMPSRPLDAYTGTFHQPKFGTITIVREGDRLTAVVENATYQGTGLNWSTHLRYCGMDVFEAVEERFRGYTLFFIPDRKEHLDSVAVKFKRADARETLFSRVPDSGLLNESHLEQFMGEYTCGDKLMNISLKDGRIVLHIPGQAALELVPRSGAEFNLKNIPGYYVEFERDETGAVCSVVVTEPNGVSTLRKSVGTLELTRA